MTGPRELPVLACRRCHHEWTVHLRPTVLGTGRRRLLVGGRCTRVSCPCLRYRRARWWHRPVDALRGGV